MNYISLGQSTRMTDVSKNFRMDFYLQIMLFPLLASCFNFFTNFCHVHAAAGILDDPKFAFFN